MGLALLLGRLDRVRRSSTDPDQYSARCPAHEDKGPSLAVRLTDDGRLLLHCFAGCSTDDVLGALGLEFRDLMPESLTWDKPLLTRLRQPFGARTALECLTGESAVIAIAAADIAEGKILSAADLERISVAAGRIASALEVTHATPR